MSRDVVITLTAEQAAYVRDLLRAEFGDEPDLADLAVTLDRALAERDA